MTIVANATGTDGDRLIVDNLEGAETLLKGVTAAAVTRAEGKGRAFGSMA